MSTKGTLSNTIKSDSWYILPRTGIHSGYIGHVPFWKVWSKITSAVKHFTEPEQKKERKGEITRPFQKQKIHVHVCTTCAHMHVHVYNRTCKKYRIQKHNNGRRGHGEGERLNLLWSIVVTAPVFHFDTSWLKALARTNVTSNDLTLDTSHAERSELKALAS